jgi:hypothetical protein
MGTSIWVDVRGQSKEDLQEVISILLRPVRPPHVK